MILFTWSPADITVPLLKICHLSEATIPSSAIVFPSEGVQGCGGRGRPIGSHRAAQIGASWAGGPQAPGLQGDGPCSPGTCLFCGQEQLKSVVGGSPRHVLLLGQGSATAPGPY